MRYRQVRTDAVDGNGHSLHSGASSFRRNRLSKNTSSRIVASSDRSTQHAATTTTAAAAASKYATTAESLCRSSSSLYCPRISSLIYDWLEVTAGATAAIPHSSSAAESNAESSTSSTTTAGTSAAVWDASWSLIRLDWLGRVEVMRIVEERELEGDL